MQAGTVNIKLMADIMDLQAKMQQAEMIVGNSTQGMGASFGGLNSSISGINKALASLGLNTTEALERVKTAWDGFKDFTERQVIIWGTALAVGVSAAVLGAVYAAYKGISFGVGLITGESYKSENIDFLIGMNKEVTALQTPLKTTSVYASGLNEALKAQGVSALDYVSSINSVNESTRSNGDELDRLGVKYKDNNGALLETNEVLKNASIVLESYKEGMDRDQAAKAIAMGTEKQIQETLSVTAEKIEIAKERLIDYGLIIGNDTQEAVAKYEDAMRGFARESDLTSQGFKRAIADNIMPALTDLATFFKDGFPGAVMAFRYSIASITSLFYGLKTAVYIAAESVVGGVHAVGLSISGLAVASGKAMSGDFSGAKDSLIQGWEDAKNRIGGIGANIATQARNNSAAMSLAWGIDSITANQAESSVKAIGRAWKAAEKESNSSAPQVNPQIKAYADLIASINEKISVNNLEADAGKKLTESEKQALDIKKMVEKGTISASDASSARTKKILLELDASEKLRAASESRIASEKAIRETGDSDLKSITDQIDKQREHNAEIGKTKEQIELAREAKVNAATANLQLESNAITALLTQADLADVLTEKDKELYAQRLGYLDRIIGKRQEDANLLRQGAELEKQAAATTEQLKMLQDVEGTAKSVFMDVATHGTDAFEKIGRTLKASVIDALYQLTVKKFVVNVVGSVTSAGAETMALAASGGSSGALSSASNAYSLYGAASGYSGSVNAAAGLMGAGATAGSSALALGYGNAVGAMGGDALGAMIAGNASWAGVAAEGGATLAAAAETGAAAIAAATETGAAAIAGASAGSAAAAAGPLAAIGPVGWTALAAVAAISIFGGNKGNPTSSTGDSNIKFDALGNETSRLDMATVTAFKAVASTGADDIVRGVQAQYAAAAKALGATVADSAFAYSGNTGKGGKESQFALRGGVGSSYYGGGDVAATPEALKLETSRVILAALQGSELPKYLSGMFDGLSAASLNQSQIDQIMSAATAYTAFHAQLDAMPFENLKDLSYDTAASLIAAAGGMDALNTNLGAYYSNFYSAEEKRGQTIKNINLATEGSGLNAATATAESFRALVDAQDVTTESGRKTYTQLLSVSSAFYSLGDNLRKLQDDTANLQIELMRAQGNKSGADSAQYILDTKGMGEAERAVFNYNASIKNQATALTERFDLEDKLRAAQEASMRRSGDVAGADAMQLDILSRSRAIERDKLDESNRAIYDRIIQLEDEKSASEKSAAAQKDLNSRIRQAAKDNIDLAMTNLDKAKKSTSDALAALEKSIAAEKTRVTVIRDAAAESVKTITGIFDLLKTQTTELYNSVSSTAAMQAAQGNAFIENALNNAQKTGYLPDQKQLAEAISAARGGLSSTQYATQFEADQAALITAGKLSQLQEISGTQLSAAEKSLKIAEEQLLSLDAALEYQKEQVNALNGINSSVLSVADAIAGLSSAMAAQKAAQAAVSTAQAAGAASLYASNPDAVKNPGKTGLDFWQGQIEANGYDATAAKFDASVGGIIGDIKGWYSANPNATKTPDTAGINYWAGEVDYMGQAAAKEKFDKTVAAMTGTALPSYAVGANYIPHDQIAQLHEGEAVVPKAYNPAAGGVGGGNTERLESLVEALTAEVMRLQGLVAEGNDYGRRTSTAVNGNPDQPILVQTV